MNVFFVVVVLIFEIGSSKITVVMNAALGM